MNPCVTTRQDAANDAAARWRGQYERHWSSQTGWQDKRVIYDALVALGPTPSPEAVNRVIGNNSWTDLRCDQCGASVERIVTVGAEPDYESATASLCGKCLRAAVAAMEAL